MRSRALRPVRWPAGLRPGAGRSPPPLGRCCRVSAKSALTCRARSTNRLTASVLHEALYVIARLTDCQRRQCDQLFAVDRHALPARSQHDHAGTLPFDAGHQPGHRPQHVLAVVQHQQQLLLWPASRGASPRATARRGCVSGTPPPPPPLHRQDRAPAPVRPATPRPDIGAVRRLRPVMPSGSCRLRPHRSPSPPANVSSAAATSRHSALRPMNELTCAGRFPGNESRVRSGGKSSRSPSRVSWKIRMGRPRSRSRCSPRSTSSIAVGQLSAHEHLGGTGDDGLPAMAAVINREQRLIGRLA